jgi:hypothetical protein
MIRLQPTEGKTGKRVVQIKTVTRVSSAEAAQNFINH